jgi:hypothetical protein
MEVEVYFSHFLFTKDESWVQEIHKPLNTSDRILKKKIRNTHRHRNGRKSKKICREDKPHKITCKQEEGMHENF